MSVILAFIAAFEAALTKRAWNCVTSDKSFSSTTGSRTLGFRHRQYGRLFLAIVGLLVFVQFLVTKALVEIEDNSGWNEKNIC